MRFLPADASLTPFLIDQVNKYQPKDSDSTTIQGLKQASIRVVGTAAMVAFAALTVTYQATSITIKSFIVIFTVPLGYYGVKVPESIQGKEWMKHATQIGNITVSFFIYPIACALAPKSVVDIHRVLTENSYESLLKKLSENEQKIQDLENEKTQGQENEKQHLAEVEEQLKNKESELTTKAVNQEYTEAANEALSKAIETHKEKILELENKLRQLSVENRQLKDSNSIITLDFGNELEGERKEVDAHTVRHSNHTTNTSAIPMPPPLTPQYIRDRTNSMPNFVDSKAAPTTQTSETQIIKKPLPINILSEIRTDRPRTLRSSSLPRAIPVRNPASKPSEQQALLKEAIKQRSIAETITNLGRDIRARVNPKSQPKPEIESANSSPSAWKV